MKKTLSLILAAAMSLALVSCSSNSNNLADSTSSAASSPAGSSASSSAAAVEGDLDYIKDKGEMVIGYTVYAPMNYTDENGVFTGFDTELATAVCGKLGVEPVFQLIDWGTKEIELAGKTIDCIWNGMTLDAEREANMNCTQPYVKNAQVVVMKAGSDYANTASLADKSVCAEIGSAGESTIQGDDNLSQALFVGKPVQTDCLLEVKAGTCDAAVLDLTLAKAMIGEGTDYADLEIVDELAVEYYGVAFRKGSDVRDEVNKCFDELAADGTLGALADKYSLDLAD